VSQVGENELIDQELQYIERRGIDRSRFQTDNKSLEQ
jgi:hypothetical protein